MREARRFPCARNRQVTATLIQLSGHNFLLRILQLAICVAILLGFAPTQLAAQKKPYTLSQVLELIGGRVPESRILEMVRAQCVDFPVSEESDFMLRQAGARPELITEFRKVCRLTASSSPQTHYLGENPHNYGGPVEITMFVGRRPLELLNDDGGTYLPPGSDLNGAPPYVKFNQPSNGIVTAVAFGIGIRPLWTAIDGEYFVDDGAHMGTIGVSIAPWLPIMNSPIRLILGGGARGILGETRIGKVGAYADGDFRATDGRTFDQGSEIWAFGWGIGWELIGGIAVHVKAPFFIFGEAIFSEAQTAGNWTYSVVARDKSFSHTLAREWVRSNTDFRSRGYGWRVGIGL